MKPRGNLMAAAPNQSANELHGKITGAVIPCSLTPSRKLLLSFTLTAK